MFGNSEQCWEKVMGQEVGYNRDSLTMGTLSHTLCNGVVTQERLKIPDVKNKSLQTFQ